MFDPPINTGLNTNLNFGQSLGQPGGMFGGQSMGFGGRQNNIRDEGNTFTGDMLTQFLGNNDPSPNPLRSQSAADLPNLVNTQKERDITQDLGQN